MAAEMGKSGQIWETKPKTGQMGFPGELQFFSGMLWKIELSGKIQDKWSPHPQVKKVKAEVLYSASYTANNRNQPCITISDMAVDWQEPMVLEHKQRPYIARASAGLHPISIHQMVPADVWL